MSNSMVQPLIAVLDALVTVILPSKPVPQSDTLVNVAVKPGAALAGATVTNPSKRVAAATPVSHLRIRRNSFAQGTKSTRGSPWTQFGLDQHERQGLDQYSQDKPDIPD